MPNCLDDYVAENNPIRVVEVFVDELDLAALGFSGVVPEATGRPAYHPASLLKVYLYGYLNRIQSSRRLERETQRNVELMWLTGRLMPDSRCWLGTGHSRTRGCYGRFARDPDLPTRTPRGLELVVSPHSKRHDLAVCASRHNGWHIPIRML